VKVRYSRDWEGLCSERREDIVGEYAVCFDYTVYIEIEEEEGKGRGDRS
jgi:hypothetical protein